MEIKQGEGSAGFGSFKFIVQGVPPLQGDSSSNLWVLGKQHLM